MSADGGTDSIPDVSIEQLLQIAEQAKAVFLSEWQYAVLVGFINTFQSVVQALQASRCSIARLKRIIFGAKTETNRNVLGEQHGNAQPCTSGPKHDGNAVTPEGSCRKMRAGCSTKRRGHGRRAAAAYTGATRTN